MAKERMTAIKNIRYLFESDEIENDRVMFCGLKGLGFENFQKRSSVIFIKTQCTALLQKEHERLQMLKKTKIFNTVIAGFRKNDVQGSCPTINLKKDDDFEYLSKSMIAINKEPESPGFGFT